MDVSLPILTDVRLVGRRSRGLCASADMVDTDSQEFVAGRHVDAAHPLRGFCDAVRPKQCSETWTPNPASRRNCHGNTPLRCNNETVFSMVPTASANSAATRSDARRRLGKRPGTGCFTDVEIQSRRL